MDISERHIILTGKDAERFDEAMKNVKPLSKDKIDKMWRNYNGFNEKITEKTKTNR